MTLLMKIGFWNINGNRNILNTVHDFAHLNFIDFLVLFESPFQPATVLAELNKSSALFHFYAPITSDFIQIYTRFSTSLIKDVSDEGRLSAKEYISVFGTRINFVFVHAPSKLNYDEADQDAYASSIKLFIDAVEHKTNNIKSIVLGDFNMDPFQKGMVQSTGLHAIFDRNVVMGESRTIQGKDYKYFYNPMWSFFGELGKGNVNGTYYYRSSKPICYFWNIFDQVLVRPVLLNSEFNESTLNIVTSFGSKNLLKDNGLINSNISDHLPVEFELNII